MQAQYASVARATRSLLQLRPTLEDFERFKRALVTLIERTEEVRKSSTSGALEETEKGLLKDFLRDSFYGHLHVGNINYKGNTGADLAIRSAKGNTLVLFECKSGSNATEMVTPEELLRKAFLEAVAYYCFEKEELKNDHLKNVVITNVREWYVFDAADFRAATHGKVKVRDAFTQWNKGNWDNSSTNALHKRLAELLAENTDTLEGYHVDLWYYKKYLNRDDEEARSELLKLYRFFCPGFLLREGTGKDSNTLNKNFYNELLHILGLQEVKDKGVKRIKRMAEGQRQPGMLIENAITRLKSEGTFARLKDREQYGATEEEQLFAVGMELCITWLDRILFLKLLEAQLLRYHGGDRNYAFLTPTDEGQQYDYLNTLFFDVMAKEPEEREPDVRKQFVGIPYLNSTLFVPSELEFATLRISGLRDNMRVPVFDRSVLIAQKLKVQELQALDYLLRFLDAYDFGSTPGDTFTSSDRPLITASVLGLIFEKLNGYKDGSFYTPGFITMYMCRATLRPAVVQRFNERFGLDLSGFEALVNYCHKLNEPQRIAEAEAVIDALRICDPAVGSGHFLVSALNELLAIKSELGLLTDADGKPLHNWAVTVANDEITITDRKTDEPFRYAVPASGPIATEVQRVQSTLFEQKRKLIEGCLFGVDINPNSVKICRLRLWIELLKHAYYLPLGQNHSVTSSAVEKRQVHAPTLRTLPNIDINIKRGNSLFSRYKLTDEIHSILSSLTFTADMYRGLVADYKEASDRKERERIEQELQRIERLFSKRLYERDPRLIKLNRSAEELFNLNNEIFSGAAFKDDAAREKHRTKKEKLEAEIAALDAALDSEKRGLAHGGAFEWRHAFPEVLDDKGKYRGFDVVLGNPPYIRQEELHELKDHLRTAFAETFASTADLFVYFMQLGHQLLAPNGWFCYIVANKWMRAGYGAKLRAWLGERTLVQLIDFGDLPVFEEATTYPCIVLTHAPAPVKSHAVQALTMPALHTEDLEAYVTTNALHLPQKDLVRNDYRIAGGDENALLEKIRNAGVPLGGYLKGKVYRGVLTGLNEAFVIDAATRERLIAEDKRSEEVIKPFLVGRDLSRYQNPEYKRFLVLFRRGDTKARFGNVDEATAWKELSARYPAIASWLEPHSEKARARGDKGEYWWELRACDYYDRFEQDKILYPDIAPFPEFQLAQGASYCGNTCYFIPSGDRYLLGILNSKVFAFYYASVSTVMRGGYFRFFSQYVEAAPIPVPSTTVQAQLTGLVERRLGMEGMSAEAAAVEREIDEVVYGLYGLTEKERRMVEGANDQNE